MVGMASALLLFFVEFTTAKAGIRPTLLECYGNTSEAPLERAVEKLMKRRFRPEPGVRRRKPHKRWKSAEDLHWDDEYYSKYY